MNEFGWGVIAKGDDMAEVFGGAPGSVRERARPFLPEDILSFALIFWARHKMPYFIYVKALNVKNAPSKEISHAKWRPPQFHQSARRASEVGCESTSFSHYQ
jgi:hypothetical protein